MAERIEFLKKYRHLEQRWGIKGPTLSGILISADLQLIDELSDDTPFNISTYHRDGRDDSQYIYDLIDGRIFESILTSWFANRKRKLERVGSDSNNEIVRDKEERITANFDLIDLESGEKIEVQMSTDIRKEYHIKKNKGNRIIKEGGVVIFIILESDKYFEVRKEDLIDSEVVYNSAWRKECYEIIPSDFHSMSC